MTEYRTRLPAKATHENRNLLNVAAELWQLNLRYAEHQTHNLLAFWHDYFGGMRAASTPTPAQAIDYLADAAERHVLFWDVLRERGNRYIDYIEGGNPPVLAFEYEEVLDAKAFPHPVNHALVRILPRAGHPGDPKKRPFVIIDPRAGHGPGIGGFKDDSQVGIALEAGHPVYFVVFKPHPIPGQTLRHVAEAEWRFLSYVSEHHPDAPKPCVLGNCQGGWAAVGVAAAHPDLAGPLVLSGAPLAYWAGETGKNPMRYMGGLMGGSWVSYLLGDLGHGQFDGANLVSNFEGLDLANTYWDKYYNLYAKVDTERERFLDFERWWGGYTLMTSEEIRVIVDNLFIGNKLSRGMIMLDRAEVLDLKNITQPIIVFCSAGDNITPPEQALNWIADLYDDERAIKAAGQVIVYIVHETTGHLGIFVSSKIIRRETTQIADTLDQIEALPPGLYEMTIVDSVGDKPADVRLEERDFTQLFHRGGRQQRNDAEFELVKVISEWNAAAYELFLGPLVRGVSSEWSAEMMRQFHPLRVAHWGMSDLNPFLWAMKPLANHLRDHRHPADETNPLLEVERTNALAIDFALDSLRDARDIGSETLFYGVYGVLTSLGIGRRLRNDAVVRTDRKHAEMLKQNALADLAVGDKADAMMRILLLLIHARGYLDRSEIDAMQRQLRGDAAFRPFSDAELRQKLHHQTMIVAYRPREALAALPKLLADPDDRRHVLALLGRFGLQGDSKDPASARTLWKQITALLDAPGSAKESDLHQAMVKAAS